MPVAMKCQINSQFKPDLPQHKPGSPWENWSLPTTSQLHLVCTTLSLLRTILDPVAVPKLWFLCSCLCCRDVRPSGPNQTQLGRTLCGTLLASLRVARLGWPILDPVAVPKLWFLCSCLCCRDLGSIANKDSLEEHLQHVASILASGKTRMARKTNNSTTA